MNWEALTAVSTAALVATGAGAIYFAYRQIENERGYRRIENLEEQMERFDSDPVGEYRRALAQERLDAARTRLRKLDVDNPPNCAYELLNFFEHIAFLVEKGHLNLYDVWHTFDYWATAYYYDFRAVIELEQRDDVSSYSDFVNLISQLRRIQIEETGQENTWLEDELVGFYNAELTDTKKPYHRRQSRVGGQKPAKPSSLQGDAKASTN